MNNLSELWKEARQYGRVNIYTHNDGTYSANIEFESIAHTELKAKSGFNIKTPEEAVYLATKKAKEIVDSMKAFIPATPQPLVKRIGWK